MSFDSDDQVYSPFKSSEKIYNVKIILLKNLQNEIYHKKKKTKKISNMLKKYENS